jgi:hypothetical protein
MTGRGRTVPIVVAGLAPLRKNYPRSGSPKTTLGRDPRRSGSPNYPRSGSPPNPRSGSPAQLPPVGIPSQITLGRDPRIPGNYPRSGSPQLPSVGIPRPNHPRSGSPPPPHSVVIYGWSCGRCTSSEEVLPVEPTKIDQAPSRPADHPELRAARSTIRPRVASRTVPGELLSRRRARAPRRTSSEPSARGRAPVWHVATHVPAAPGRARHVVSARSRCGARADRKEADAKHRQSAQVDCHRVGACFASAFQLVISGAGRHVTRALALQQRMTASKVGTSVQRPHDRGVPAVVGGLPLVESG